MYTTTRTFDQVTLGPFRKTLPCPVCGKKLRRQRLITNTINPFNKNPDGTVKTRAEVLKSVQHQGKVYRLLPEHCRACLLAIPYQQRHAVLRALIATAEKAAAE